MFKKLKEKWRQDWIESKTIDLEKSFESTRLDLEKFQSDEIDELKIKHKEEIERIEDELINKKLLIDRRIKIEEEEVNYRLKVLEDRKVELAKADNELKNQIRLIEAKASPSSVWVEAFTAGVNKTWEMLRPISNSKTVIINEVDKANSGIRNAMLSIMAEKKIFDGGEQVNCNWETFVATANEIPKGEETSPFFDRFVVQYNMPGININERLAFMKDRSYKKVLELNVPTLEEVYQEPLDYENIKIMMELINNQKDINMSDRSQTKLDILVKAAKIIWEISEVDAIVKVATLVAPQIVTGLEQKLLPKELSAFNTAFDNYKDDATFIIKKTVMKDLENILKDMDKNRRITPAQVSLCKSKYDSLKAKFNTNLPVMQ